MIQIRSSRGINDIPITSMDNLDTFRQRVAASLGTIPSYLLFESEIESLDALKTMKSIGVLSLMDSINDLKQKFGKEEFSTESLFALASRFPDIDKNDIFAYWVIKNPALEDINYRMLIDEEISSIEGITPISEILDTERKENRWIKTYTDAVASNKTKSSKFLKVATEFEKVPSVESSSIVIEKITIGIKLTLSNVSMEDLFDKIQCNMNIPFCSYNGVFKVLDPEHNGLNSFSDDDLFNMSLNTSPESINIKYSDTPISNETIISKLPDIIIYTEKGFVNMALQINLTVQNKDVYAMDMLRRMNESLNGSYVLDPTDVKEDAITASYIVPNQTIDSYVYADLLMMNGAISTYFANDESIKATKKKSVIFSHFFIDAYEGLFSIKNERIEKSTEDVTKYKAPMKTGTEYIKVKLLRCKNIDDAERQRTLFTKVLTMYNTGFNSIVRVYNEYIQDFDPVKKAKPVTEKKKGMALKDIDPELFGIEGYSRTCGKKPTIIEDDEVDQYEEEGYQVMQFPKEGAYGTRRNYVCEHKTHPYPGVSRNQDLSNEMYPYVPCCFVNDQTVKQTSGYRTYFEGLEEKDIVYQQILTTNKFAPFNWYAYLPKTLDEMFTMFDNRFKYVRKGVARSKSSFLDCILEATGDKKIRDKTELERIEYVEKKRKTLAKKVEINSSIQANWGMNVEEITNVIMNMNAYLDPTRFCAMLEDVYKVNIYLYTRNEENPMGTLLYRRAKFVDMERGERYENSILIFEHMGSESDRAKYPMCEIIGQWQAQGEENVYMFPHTHSIAEGAEWFQRNGMKYFKSQTQQFSGTLLPFAEFIESQIVDTYGKTRGFVVSHEGEPVSIALGGVANYNIVTEDVYSGMDMLSYACDWNVIRKFLRKYEFGVDMVFTTDGIVAVGIQSHYGDIVFRIKTEVPLEAIISQFKGVSVSRSNPFSDAQESMMNVYMRNRRYATIAKNLFLYELSKFMKSIDEIVINRDMLFNFIKQRVVIDEEYKYGEPSIYFEKNKSFYKRNKLVMNSKELLIRLIYYARLYAMRYGSSLREYYKRNACDEYYVDIFDYTTSPGMLLFSNSRALLRMKRGVPDILNIQESVVPGLHTMIVRNPDIEGGNIVKLDLAVDYNSAVRTMGGSSGFYATKPGHIIVKMGESPNILVTKDENNTYYYTIHVL